MEFLKVTANFVDELLRGLICEELGVLLETLDIGVYSPLMSGNFMLALLSFLLIAAVSASNHAAELTFGASAVSLKPSELFLFLGDSLGLILGIDGCLALSEGLLDSSKSLHWAVVDPGAGLYLSHCRPMLGVELQHGSNQGLEVF